MTGRFTCRVMKPFSSLATLALVSLMLSGCLTSAVLDTYSAGIFQREDINMTEKNYAAADYLAHQAKTFISRRDLLKPLPLTDLDTPTMSATIGNVISEQIGVRFAQLGYAVDISEVTTSTDTNYLKPADSQMKEPKFTLSGTYVRQQRTLDVKLRITQVKTGRVIASYDYALPLSREVARLAEPQPRIMKLQ